MTVIYELTLMAEELRNLKFFYKLISSLKSQIIKNI